MVAPVAEFRVSKRVRIGVAGAGVFGAHHASKYANHQKSCLAAVYDINVDRSQQLAQQLGAVAHEHFESFLKELDAVIIATPAHSHFDYAAEALNMGCHVFIEKPVATTLEEADTLIRMAASRQLVLQVGHQERYVVAATGLLNRRRKPLRVECQRCAPPTGRGTDVSVVFDLMVHDLDLVRQITGSDLAHISASGDEDKTQADLMLKNGVVASLTADRSASECNRRIKVVYDDGVVDIDLANRTLRNSTPAAINGEFDADRAAFRDPLAHGADLFLASIMEGVAPIVTGQHGRAAIEWALKIEKAKAGTSDAAPADERLRA